MTKSILNESTIRRMMKLSNIKQNVTNKFIREGYDPVKDLKEMDDDEQELAPEGPVGEVSPLGDDEEMGGLDSVSDDEMGSDLPPDLGDTPNEEPLDDHSSVGDEVSIGDSMEIDASQLVQALADSLQKLIDGGIEPDGDEGLDPHMEDELPGLDSGDEEDVSLEESVQATITEEIAKRVARRLLENTRRKTKMASRNHRKTKRRK